MKSRFKACVVIPTLNGGELFGRVLDAVLGQECSWPFEVIVVDSGSSDGTCDIVKVRQGGTVPVRLHCIAKSDFGHGKSRNLGASLSESEFIAFLTQDALPANEHWLARLVACVEQRPDIAGAFGRHLPYPEAHPLTKRELTEFFDGMAAYPIVGMDDRSRYLRDQGYRQILHYYSDNNSCMRRSVWRQIPYPDVSWGEDQLWARRIIEHGYGKAYAHDAAVYHSHDFPFRQRMARASEEHGFWQEYLNYSGVDRLSMALRFTHLFSREQIKWMRHHESGWPAHVPQVYMRNFARFMGEFRGRRRVLNRRARRGASS